MKKLNLIMSLLCCVGSGWLAPSTNGSESSSGPDLGMQSNPVDRIQLAEVQGLDMDLLNISHPLHRIGGDIEGDADSFLRQKLTQETYDARVDSAGYILDNGARVEMGSNHILTICRDQNAGNESILKLVCGEAASIVYEPASKSLALNNEKNLVEYTGPVLSKAYHSLRERGLPSTTPPALLLILSYLPHNPGAIRLDEYDSGWISCRINLREIYAHDEIIGTAHPDYASLIISYEPNRSNSNQIFLALNAAESYKFHDHDTESTEFANEHVPALIEAIRSLLPSA